jgi:hypothetical protein
MITIFNLPLLPSLILLHVFTWSLYLIFLFFHHSFFFMYSHMITIFDILLRPLIPSHRVLDTRNISHLPLHQLAPSYHAFDIINLFYRPLHVFIIFHRPDISIPFHVHVQPMHSTPGKDLDFRRNPHIGDIFHSSPKQYLSLHNPSIKSCNSNTWKFPYFSFRTEIITAKIHPYRSRHYQYRRSITSTLHNTYESPAFAPSLHTVYPTRKLEKCCFSIVYNTIYHLLWKSRSFPSSPDKRNLVFMARFWLWLET